jgi:hypothetical protein
MYSSMTRGRDHGLARAFGRHCYLTVGAARLKGPDNRQEESHQKQDDHV